MTSPVTPSPAPQDYQPLHAADARTTVECPACGSDDSETERVVRPPEQHRKLFPWDEVICRRLDAAYTGPATYEMTACRNCGLVYAVPLFAPNASWYAMLYDALGAKAEARWEFEEVLGRIRPQSLYEIGCGSGMFLRMCRERGIAAYGIDFSDYAIRACAAHGLTAFKINGSLVSSELAVLASQPDVIASFHVLEHLARPDELFRHAFRVSRQDATLWVSVPSPRRPGRYLRCEEPLDDPPHHMSRWTEVALSECGRRNGWRLDELLFEPFSWGAALYAMTTRFGIYQSWQRRGWARRRLPDLAVRAMLAPAAMAGASARICRLAVSGFSMLAKFQKRS